jgi:hypothetical protein
MSSGNPSSAHLAIQRLKRLVSRVLRLPDPAGGRLPPQSAANVCYSKRRVDAIVSGLWDDLHPTCPQIGPARRALPYDGQVAHNPKQ